MEDMEMGRLFGWTGKILRVNLSDGSISDISTMRYAMPFIGGRGIASRMYWNEMDSDIGSFDPDNHLFFMNGPLAGTQAPGASRWVVLGKSPMAFPEQYAFGNLGGRFGAALKWAGLDGLDIVGASRKPVILVIGTGGKCFFEDAADLWGKDAAETIETLEKRFGGKANVAAIGEAGEKKIRFATIMGSHGISATKGFGAVMGSKRLKAVVLRANRITLPIAHPEKFREVRKQITALWKGEISSRYWNEPMIEGIEKVKAVPCYSCPGICRRGIYQSSTGEKGYRKSCVSAFYYSKQEMDRTGKMAEATFHATQLANKHGLCILELRFLVTWLPEALKMGIADQKETGLNPDELGSSEWVETLINLIINRKGIGDLLAEGSRRSAKELGAEDLLEGVVTKAGFDADYYNPRLFIINAPIYATEPVYPITQLHRVSFPMVKWMIWMGTEGMMGFLTTDKLRHLAKLFWGDEKAAEFDTPDKKGEAAVLIQNRSYAMENIVFCDWFWPIDFSGNSESGVGDPSLEARLFSSVTGEDMDESGYLRSGERCVNLCRAIYMREGRRGRIDDVMEEFNFTNPLQMQDPPVGLFNPEYMMPGKNGKLFTRKGATVDREVFKKVMDDYYHARCWDVDTGLFTKNGLKNLDLDDMIPELEGKGFLADEKERRNRGQTYKKV
jgi:aldehyde:ferredoxin oxidoreductase